MSSPITDADGSAFTPAGAALLDTVARRTGRGAGLGEDRPARAEDLLYAYIVTGTAVDIADHMQQCSMRAAVAGHRR
ncbi:hypothetical protein ACFYVR_08970 [Rhodococcus sp. NPDC003318]|uniref:hypothetical protein n=1 Tax=Rhodococcus sp. NPDC003318 TaxID=3364503 RepID=UPI0036CFB14D